MRLTDSHAHLNFTQFDADRDAVIERAREAGVTAILNVGTDLASSKASIALAQQHDFIYAAVGVHPHDAKHVNERVLDQLRVLTRYPKVVAIGEIGLDYYRDRSPRPVQRRAFADQLALAAELELPVIIHSRDAHDDVMEALRDWITLPLVGGEGGLGVLHSYSGGPERLDEVLEMGFYVSISGPITFPKADRLRKVAEIVPLERLLVETDCPFLTPVPRRGRRNEPALVRRVVEAVARARNVPAETVAQAAANNLNHLFDILT
ncbi:MAG: TatD family hydrolase [Chloroflexota bacterium]|nr:TatD family hydrolase [Chloroflexota bacterium]